MWVFLVGPKVFLVIFGTTSKRVGQFVKFGRGGGPNNIYFAKIFNFLCVYIYTKKLKLK